MNEAVDRAIIAIAKIANEEPSATQESITHVHWQCDNCGGTCHTKWDKARGELVHWCETDGCSGSGRLESNLTSKLFVGGEEVTAEEVPYNMQDLIICYSEATARLISNLVGGNTLVTYANKDTSIGHTHLLPGARHVSLWPDLTEQSRQFMAKLKSNLEPLWNMPDGSIKYLAFVGETNASYAQLTQKEVDIMSVLIVKARPLVDRFSGDGRWIQRLPIASAVVIIIVGCAITLRTLMH